MLQVTGRPHTDATGLRGEGWMSVAYPARQRYNYLSHKTREFRRTKFVKITDAFSRIPTTC